MTDRLPLLGASITFGCLSLFVWAATADPGAVAWPPREDPACLVGIVVKDASVVAEANGVKTLHIRMEFYEPFWNWFTGVAIDPTCLRGELKAGDLA